MHPFAQTNHLSCVRSQTDILSAVEIPNAVHAAIVASTRQLQFHSNPHTSTPRARGVGDIIATTTAGNYFVATMSARPVPGVVPFRFTPGVSTACIAVSQAATVVKIFAYFHFLPKGGRSIPTNSSCTDPIQSQSMQPLRVWLVAISLFI